MKLSLLLVTYNRLELLKKALKCVSDDAVGIEELILVDNFSTDDTFSYLTDLFDMKIANDDFESDVSSCEIWKGQLNSIQVTLIRLASNTGGSGGFYTGLKYFQEKSTSDWVWGMDDDAFIKKDALNNLQTAINNNPNCSAFWSNCNSDAEFDKDVKPVTSWMFVGFALKKSLINKVGLPVNDYFIYHDDSEYSDRIIRAGYEILKVRDSVIEHGDFTHRSYWSKKIFGVVFSFPEMSDWKLYYYFRNDILKSSYNRKVKATKVAKLTLLGLKLCFIKPEKLNVVFKSIFHGLIGKAGIYIRP
ncbi:glycosyltransferase [Vibrio sp. 10N.222.54.B6]|uniref:glycosyltransferase n=1 Tax=Vibrio sp. 10N.222.54.B6 TaxID=1884468 RepID=UPI000CBE51A7|nr:glycosyltransferase [Vibrio sp. 10N.222.54.B6]PMO17532.1 hypothetical protein BCT16_14960 [Vibrio sp. 10N.222.54.B6]